jgi:hypothetical protein
MTQAIALPNDIFEPPCHDPRYTRLPDEAQATVSRRLSIMRRVNQAPKKTVAIAQEALKERGYGRGTLINLWYAFLSTRDWFVLLDTAKAGPACYRNKSREVGLPQEFREYLGQQWAMRQRDKFRPVWKDLKRRYAAWQAGDHSAKIEGYPACPAPMPGTGLPRGWSYENLLKIAGKEATIYDRTLIHIGTKKASQFTPKVYTTRVGIEVGQQIIIDDCWVDFFTLYRGSRARPLSFHILDSASGCNSMRGYKPAITDEQGTQERLKEREMVFLLAAYFCRYGFHPGGTLIIAEKGTATVRPVEQELFAELSNGAITVDTGPSGGGPGVIGLFCDYGGGNPRHKAPLESWFNLWHNETDHMLEFPGQLGSNSRLNAPEGTLKMAARDEAMHRFLTVLPPADRELIRFNLLQWEKACPALDARTEVVNTRREHNLNDWRECGHVVPAFRLDVSLPWIPASIIPTLDEPTKQHLAIVLTNPDLCGEVRLSPREVFDAGVGKLKRFSIPQAAMIIKGTEPAEPTVRQGRLEVPVPEIDHDEPLAYGPIVQDCRGMEIALQNGDKHAVRVNPFAPDIAFVYGPRGQWIGYVKRTLAGRKNDPASLAEQFKDKSKAVSQWTEHSRRLAAPLSEKAASVAHTNAQVIGKAHQRARDLADAADAALLRSQH